MNTSDPRYLKIHATVRRIPRGSVASYGQIAELAGLPGRARMVGKVLGLAPANKPLPWHRVLRANGQLAFPEDSQSANIQTERLRDEGIAVKHGRVAMKTYQWQPSLADIFELDSFE